MNWRSRQFDGAPEIPGRRRAVRPPAFAKFEQLPWPGQIFPAIGPREPFAHSIIGDEQDVGPAECKDEQHFDGPWPNAADRSEALENFGLAQFSDLARSGDATRDCL